MERVLTVSEVAEHLNLTEVAIRKFIREERLRASKIGRVWRIRESAIQEFLEAHEPNQTTQEKPKAPPWTFQI